MKRRKEFSNTEEYINYLEVYVDILRNKFSYEECCDCRLPIEHSIFYDKAYNPLCSDCDDKRPNVEEEDTL